MVISFTSCFCEPNVRVVEGGCGIICRWEVGSAVESDRGGCARPLSNNKVPSVDKASVNTAVVEGTVGTEGSSGFGHVHSHVDCWYSCVIAGHVDFVVPRGEGLGRSPEGIFRDAQTSRKTVRVVCLLNVICCISIPVVSSS